MRLLWLALALAVLLALPAALFGAQVDSLLGGEGMLGWMRQNAGWAWIAVLALLVADLVAPIPASVLMAVLGQAYGVLLGGLISAVGSFLAGLAAYGACRALGMTAAQRLCGVEGLAKARDLFDRHGLWAVALTRPLPLLPEVIACLAGLAGMRVGVFCTALASGALTTGYTFATVGAVVGSVSPAWALLASALAPLALWPLTRWAMRKASRDREGAVVIQMSPRGCSVGDPASRR